MELIKAYVQGYVDQTLGTNLVQALCPIPETRHILKLHRLLISQIFETTIDGIK